MEKNRLFIIAALACITLISISSGNALAAIDGGYVGTSVCAGCHPGIDADFQHSGHPFKFRQTSGADCGAGACDAISNVLPTPLVSSISTLTNDLLIVDDGFGDLDWSVIQYVIGGWGWKSRYGIFDATDADGDGIDDTGYVWTGGVVQYNVLTDTWSAYHTGEDKAYNCGICHNTNGTRDMLASRTEPWATIPGAGVGFTSQWTFDGVQCEACHGPGEAHEVTPTDPYPVDTTKALCGTCHNRSGADDHGADTSGGYIRHHEQYNEQVGNTLEPGVHVSLECNTCHNPHKRSHTIPDFVATALGVTDNDMTAEERLAVVSCESCHAKSIRFHSDIQCIDCHMPAATKSATAETGTYGKSGDVKTHIFLINPDPLAEDTNASPNSVTGTNVAHNYLTLNYTCGQCHDSSMSTYVGVPLTMAELGDYANTIHRSPVRQTIGMDDVEFNALTEAECRVCHDSGVPDRHHMLYGSAIPIGVCSSANGTCDVSGDPCVELADCTDPLDTACNAGTPAACLQDEDCAQPLDSCFITGVPCPTNPEDPCPQSYTGQTCGQPICYGESGVVDSDTDGDGTPDGAYGCLSCHEEDNTGGVISFVVLRDCTQCHVAGLNQPNVHHKEGGTAQSGDCVACHGDLVDNPTGCKELCCASSFGPTAGECISSCTSDADCSGGALCVALGDEAACDDGHDIPTYAPSLVTPAPHAMEHLHECSDDGSACDVNTDCTEGTCDVGGAPCHDEGDCPTGEVCVGGAFCKIIDTPAAGGCAYCHSPGTDAVSGLEVVDNHDAHHHTGVYKTSVGGSQRDKCAWCHKAGNPHNAGGEDPDAIRFCENCHGYEALHNIQGDSPNPANPGSIVVGGENPGYGHIGYDAGSSDGDCWGCHGFSVAADSSALGSGVPSVYSVDPIIIAAGTATQVNITGAALTTGVPAASSDIRLTAADGTSVTIAPDSITIDALTVTINAAAGNYALQAVKDGEASNAIGITVVPDVAIIDIMCSKCLGTMTIDGSGFGEKPAGTDEDVSVTEDGRPLNVISWSDTEIKVSGARCRGEVTVESIFGSASE